MKQFYHCFGCGAHGTALDFLMNYDRLPFVEAVEDLAHRLGVEVPREGPGKASVVVHDDLDLGFGVVRLKQGGGEGGHNGLRSISASIGTKDYLRVRFGIGRPPGRQDPADFVLKRFSGAERKELEFAVDLAADAAEALLHDGLEPAQNRFHALSG